MKRNSLLLSSAALALLSASLVPLFAKEPPQAAEPAKQEAIPFVAPEMRLEADTAIRKEVMTVLGSNEPRLTFSRVRIEPRSQMYTLTMTESAPGGVKLDPARIPFEVMQPAAKPGEAKAPVFVSGFYDANSKSVQLYSAAAKTYVPAADHPFIKARLPKK